MRNPFRKKEERALKNVALVLGGTNAEGELITSKPDRESHGFGLKSIANTVKKYNGEQIAKCEDDVFTLVVRLNSKGKEANTNVEVKRF